MQLILSLVLLLQFQAQATPPTVTPFITASVVLDAHPAQMALMTRVIDGDTAIMQIGLGYDVTISRHVRLEGFNAPELHGPNKDKAQKARTRLIELMNAKQLWVKATGAITFERNVVRIYYQEAGKIIDISQQMIDEGFNVIQGE